jgi:ribosomal protection tetracycline resistance protein
LGILAHVDAGKTTLTERLLYAAGVIDALGSVDDGSTQTDTLALEQQRGITIKNAVVSFAIDDVTVNLIDTPGHPDFIAEVERVLGVLDGAVLVISAVEGVQAQTRVLMRALQRLHVPTLFFVNKTDRRNADTARVVASISERLTRAIITAPASSETANQTKAALVHPVFFGSARTGDGVDALMSGIAELLPAAEGDVDGPPSGTVFKVERGAAGQKIAYVRMFSGTLRTRARVRFGDDVEDKITAIEVFERGSAVRRASVSAREIGKVWGLREIQIGDSIGVPPANGEHHFAPPTLETVVVPRSPAESGALRVALGQLAEQDPLIDVRQDDVRHELAVSLYGEVQKEVIQATLATEYGLDVTFRETTTICIEQPVGTGAAVERLSERTNPFLATVGLRVEPGSGVTFRLEVELGAMPLAFFRAVEEAVRQTLRQGVHGWEVRDCAVAVTHCGFTPATSAGDFRSLTPLVLARALAEAGTAVHEPVHRFHLEVPADALGPVVAALARAHAVPNAPAISGQACTVEGHIPAARVHELRQQLSALTRGEGVLESRFDRYEAVRGGVPRRARSDDNPFNREEYLLRVSRRVTLVR